MCVHFGERWKREEERGATTNQQRKRERDKERGERKRERGSGIKAQRKNRLKIFRLEFMNAENVAS